jgi:hypothetical protein
MTYPFAINAAAIGIIDPSRPTGQGRPALWPPRLLEPDYLPIFAKRQHYAYLR